MSVSERGQTILIWWGLIFMYIFGITLWGLLHMMPPPPADLPAEAVAAFYVEHGFQIRLGAMVASWCSAFMVPIAVAATCQMLRVEKGVPVWSIAQLVGGVLMSMFLVFPPILWGVAAFTPTRAPEITQIMHELGTLTLATTDQFYIFQMIAIFVLSLAHKDEKKDGSWPFPRWFGYLTLWAAIAFEVGAFAFTTKTGPFSWRGAIVYWMPLSVFGFWVTVFAAQMLRALKVQAAQAKTA